MSIKNRIAKLETKHAKINGGLVLINLYPGDDEEALLRERFGADGPPPGVMVIFIRKFATTKQPDTPLLFKYSNNRFGNSSSMAA